MLGGSGVDDDDDDWGRRPGKSGTRTVTSVNSTNKLGSGVVVDVVVVVDGLPVVELVVSVAAVVDVPLLCSKMAVVDDCDVELLTSTAPTSACSVDVDSTTGLDVVVVDTVAFCNPNVFQMDGPTELNQGGLGLAVEDVGVALKWDAKKKNKL